MQPYIATEKRDTLALYKLLMLEACEDRTWLEALHPLSQKDRCSIEAKDIVAKHFLRRLEALPNLRIVCFALVLF